MKRIIITFISILYFISMYAYTLVDYDNAMKSGDYLEAIRIMKSIIKDTKIKTGDLYYKRALAYEKMGNYVYAVIDCSTALEYSPERPEYYALRGRCKQKSNDITYESDLRKGNVFEKEKQKKEFISDVNRNNKVSAVDTDIPLTNNHNPNTFVLLLCSEEYSEASISNADFANNDGLIFKEYCQRTLGIPEDNIHLKKNVTLSQIKSEIRWLKAISDEFGETASSIVYYSGHGYPDEVTHQAYLLPSDGQIYDTECGYSLATLYSELGSLRFKHSIVLLDACFSGVKKSINGGMLSSSRGIAIKPTQGTLTGNVAVLSATSSDNIAYPDPGNSHGLFTFHLLEKLKESKGNISLQDLSQYVIDKVRKSSTIKYTKTQIPTMVYSDDLQIPLSDIKLFKL